MVFNFWGLIVMFLSLIIDVWGFVFFLEFVWWLFLVFVVGLIMFVWSLIEVFGKVFVGMNLIKKFGRFMVIVVRSNFVNIIV